MKSPFIELEYTHGAWVTQQTNEGYRFWIWYRRNYGFLPDILAGEIWI